MQQYISDYDSLRSNMHIDTDNMLSLWNKNNTKAKTALSNMQVNGQWSDLFAIMSQTDDEYLKNYIMAIIIEQFIADVNAFKQNKQISDMIRSFPSEKTRTQKNINFINRLMSVVAPSIKSTPNKCREYRRLKAHMDLSHYDQADINLNYKTHILNMYLNSEGHVIIGEIMYNFNKQTIMGCNYEKIEVLEKIWNGYWSKYLLNLKMPMPASNNFQLTVNLDGRGNMPFLINTVLCLAKLTANRTLHVVGHNDLVLTNDLVNNIRTLLSIQSTTNNLLVVSYAEDEVICMCVDGSCYDVYNGGEYMDTHNIANHYYDDEYVAAERDYVVNAECDCAMAKFAELVLVYGMAAGLVALKEYIMN